MSLTTPVMEALVASDYAGACTIRVNLDRTNVDGFLRLRAELLGLRGQRTRVGQAVGADVDDEAERRAARHRAPALGELLAFGQRQRVTLAGAAADEGGGDLVLQQVRGLLLDDCEVEGAVGLEWRVGGGDESGKRNDLVHGLTSTLSTGGVVEQVAQETFGDGMGAEVFADQQRAARPAEPAAGGEEREGGFHSFFSAVG